MQDLLLIYFAIILYVVRFDGPTLMNSVHCIESRGTKSSKLFNFDPGCTDIYEHTEGLKATTCGVIKD